MAKEIKPAIAIQDEDDLLWSDDLNPNEAGSGIFQPEIASEAAEEEAEERAMVSSAAPIFDEILYWFDEEIAWASSIDGIDLESTVPASAQLLAKTRLKEHLTNCRQRLVSMREKHLK